MFFRQAIFGECVQQQHRHEKYRDDQSDRMIHAPFERHQFKRGLHLPRDNIKQQRQHHGVAQCENGGLEGWPKSREGANVTSQRVVQLFNFHDLAFEPPSDNEGRQ